jgi:hypothetical protein
MGSLRVHCFAISVDGSEAGLRQYLANPLGVGGLALHEWALATCTFHEMHGEGGDGIPLCHGGFTTRWPRARDVAGGLE